MRKILFLFCLLLCGQVYGQTSRTIIDSGDLNETVRWTLDSDSTLTISGEGDAQGSHEVGSPWCNNNADKIKQIIVSEGITAVGGYTTCGSNNVSSVQLPNSLKTIGYCAIGACEVKSVTIPENVTTIERLGFYKIRPDTLYYNAISCQVIKELDLGLKVVFIGEKVTRIPKLLFKTRSGLEKLTVPWQNPSDIMVEEDAFKYVDKANCKLIVPAGTATLYKQAEDWKDFDIVEVSGVSDNADLQSLTVADAELIPAFNPDITNYTVNIPYSRSAIGGGYEAADKNASAYYYDTPSSQFHKGNLIVGENIIEITVTAEDGITQKTYTVVVNRAAPSSNADLSELIVFNAELEPAFDANITDYTINIPFSKKDCNGSGSAADEKAHVSVGGYYNWDYDYFFRFISDEELQVGENILTLTVIAEDGITHKIYTLTVIREPAPERAETVHLTDAGTLYEYMIANYEDISNGQITKLTLTGNIDARDIYELGNNDIFLNLTELDLSGANIVEFEGAENNGETSKFYPANALPDYSFRYMRNLNKITFPETLTSIGEFVLSTGGTTQGPLLTAIEIPEGVTSIGSLFASSLNTLTTVSLPSSLTSLGNSCFIYCTNLSTITNFNPMPIEIKDAKTYHPSFYNSNHSECTLFVPAGSVAAYQEAEVWKEFTVVALSGASDNANLSEIDCGKLNNVTLTPAFSPDITEYTASVPHNYKGGCIFGISEDVNAAIDASNACNWNLSVGENILTLTVTAEDGVTQKTYTVVVTREPMHERIETIHLAEAGTLNSSLFADFFERPVTKLTLTGDIDARDIYFLDSLQYLTALDLGNANIVAYEGIAGYYAENFYPANQLPDNSLRYNINLNEIIFPETLTSIGNTVLNGMTTLSPPVTSLVIPEGVTSIGSYFAGYNNALTTVFLPSTLDSLGDYSFIDCANLSVVINHNPVPYETRGCFVKGLIYTNAPIFVPYGSGYAYKNVYSWNLLNIVELPDISEENITVTTSEENALIEWLPYEHAEGYLLKIFADEEHTDLIRTLEFDAAGQFVRELRAGDANTAFTHTLNDLSSNTTYYYTFETLAANELVLLSQSGEFTTDGGTVGTDNHPSLQPRITGYYSVLGVKLSREPESGIYIVTYDDGTAGKKVKMKKN